MIAFILAFAFVSFVVYGFAAAPYFLVKDGGMDKGTPRTLLITSAIFNAIGALGALFVIYSLVRYNNIKVFGLTVMAFGFIPGSIMMGVGLRQDANDNDGKEQ